MQTTPPNKIRTPGVRLHPKASAALGLEAEHVTRKEPPNPSTKNMHAWLGNGIRQEVRWTPRVPPKGGDVRKHGGTPSPRDKYVRLAVISSPGVARGRFVCSHQSGLAGCKSPPLLKHGAPSCLSQRQRQREPGGSSP